MRIRFLLIVLLLAAAGCRSFPPRQPGDGGAPRLTAVDSGGRPLTRLQLGSSLEMTAEGLQPRTLYEFNVAIGDRPVSFARATTDARGRIAPFLLLYHSGVIGCATRPADENRPLRFRTFEEAEEALRGQRLRTTARPVNGRSPQEGRADSAAVVMDLPIVERRSPMVYPANADGCLVNSVETQTDDLWVAGRNFQPGEVVSISVVPNQRAWYVGDMVVDVTGASLAAAPKRVTADANGRFRVRAWEGTHQQRGVYDIVAQRLDRRGRDLQYIDAEDIISYGSDSGVVLYLIYPPGGPNMDLAGRPLSGSPYFEFADSFADANDNVWAAVDPTYIPAGHSGGTYAGYHVVQHRTVAQWDPMMGGSTAIADISLNGVEVMPVKAGCINATDVIIWPAPVPVGKYDVVVDFGSSPMTYMADGSYDASLDFLDGAVQIGFQVAKNPYDLGTTPIGSASYSTDNFFPTLGAASNVDLRAVVRYPATIAGVNQPVALGTHPLFVIEHGNHGICRICTDGSLYYQRLKTAIATSNFTTFSALCTYNHVTCPDRTKNHEGYMRLLEILASRGVIAVSIDAYDLTGPVPSWIPERADLILKHLEMWANLNTPGTFPGYPNPFGTLFMGHVDMTRISVSGHSRGGEASVQAYLRNAMLPTPFSINSVSSIAPVDNHLSVLPAVPYFVILPAADGDVSSLAGAKIYDRAGSGIGDATTKSSIDVYGANHNFFNTVWAADFDDYADSNPGWPPRADFIAAADQQRLGEAYLAAFTLAHLKGETVFEDMLRGGLTYPSTAGFKNYHSRHETSHSKIDAGSVAGVPASGATELSVMNPSPHSTQVSRLGWPGATAEYAYTVPPGQRNTTGFEVLSFRVAQTSSASNPASGSQNFMIELRGGGNTRGVYAGQFDAIPKPYVRPGLTHTFMNTVRIPLHSFIINNSGVTLNDIDTIRFRFTGPATGEIYVDDVEFLR